MMTKTITRLLATAAAMAFGASAQAATTISFQSLLYSSSVPVTYTESGYTIKSNNTREPVPGVINNTTLSVMKSIGANDSGIPGVSFGRSVSFTLTGGTFTFDGLAAYFNTFGGVTNSFTVAGSLFDKQLYSMEFTATGGTIQQNNSFRAFASGSSTVFDKLVFTSGASGGSIVLDDIKVSAAAVPIPDPVVPPVTSAVPEPATWALMLAGFGLTGAAIRRRRVRFAQAVA